MLQYVTYFDTLAQIADTSAPEWHAAAAGLVAMRLVDDWLEFGAGVINAKSPDIGLARDVLAKLPDDHRLHSVLGDLIDTIEHTDQSSLQAVAIPLQVYAKTLERAEEFALAHDVTQRVSTEPRHFAHTKSQNARQKQRITPKKRKAYALPIRTDIVPLQTVRP